MGKKVGACAKKLLKSLEVSGKMPIFAGDMRNKNQEQWVVTGISRLTGYRDEISRPMSEQEARARLERELQNRRHQKFPAYTRLRVEKRLPIQLTLNFSNV